MWLLFLGSLVDRLSTDCGICWPLKCKWGNTEIKRPTGVFMNVDQHAHKFNLTDALEYQCVILTQKETTFLFSLIGAVKAQLCLLLCTSFPGPVGPNYTTALIACVCVCVISHIERKSLQFKPLAPTIVRRVWMLRWREGGGKGQVFGRILSSCSDHLVL